MKVIIFFTNFLQQLLYFFMYYFLQNIPTWPPKLPLGMRDLFFTNFLKNCSNSVWILLWFCIYLVCGGQDTSSKKDVDNGAISPEIWDLSTNLFSFTFSLSMSFVNLWVKLICRNVCYFSPIIYFPD